MATRRGTISSVERFGLAYASYLLLRPNSLARALPIPKPISNWLDDNYDLRTFFLAAGVAIVPALLLVGRQKRRRQVLAIVLVCLLVFECGQILVRGRHFAVLDVLYTWVGVAAAESLALGAKRMTGKE